MRVEGKQQANFSQQLSFTQCLPSKQKFCQIQCLQRTTTFWTASDIVRKTVADCVRWIANKTTQAGEIEWISGDERINPLDVFLRMLVDGISSCQN